MNAVARAEARSSGPREARLTEASVSLSAEVRAGESRQRADRLDVGYVRFHRTYRGVIRTWFDASFVHGIGAIHGAAEALLDTVELPPGIDVQAAGKVFLQVLGRMTEPTA